MDRALAGLKRDTLLVYLDDVIVYAKSVEAELERLRVVFQRLRQAQLKLKPAKCHLFQTKVHYLGHVVSADGVATEPEKLDVVQKWPEPTNVGEVRSFLGLVSYYRRFIRNFANIARPLQELTKKNHKFVRTEDCQSSFQELKERLMSPPILAYPESDGQLVLDTDASDYVAGAVLSQIQDGQERVIAYGSKTFNKPERNYFVTRKELLAIVVFLKHFRPYLSGRPVMVLYVG